MDWLRILIISLILLLVIFYFMNGYFLLYIINMILYPFASGPSYLPTKMKWCKELRDNYQIIRDEYINYTKQNKLKSFRDIDPNQKTTDTGDIEWPILMLRVYNKDTNKIKYFPETYSLIKKIPGCSLAMFSVLPKNKKLAPHHGPSKSVYRYHLSLIVPDASEEESKGCFIKVDNKNYYWKEGKDVMFDDTYLHSAENNTEQTRVILFLDIKRKYNNVFLDGINDLLMYFAKDNPTVTNIVKNTNNS